MSEFHDWNQQIIAEFRENGGKVGGQFEGAPVVLMHGVGRKTGKQTIHPVMYLASETDPATIYVFASKAGMHTHPDWYWNLTAAGTVTIEVGTETYDATVTELEGEERDRIYAIQAERYPGFAEYEVKTEGIRTIPVLALTRI